MTDSPTTAFDLLTTRLLQDPDLDVSATATGLHVHDRLFAYLDRDELVVDLPRERAADLVGRGIATTVPAARAEAAGAWVRIADAEDWPELADEAHRFVGEPAVGMDS
ncbi:hypothetical protein LLS1_29750 [Leifsonia sp. LS1]|uniref:hypothetical protein n=1 Tax=unclassified Leifsonia TaxID=2663824 RepID=UPI001CBE463D|nr:MULTISPECIES: hypothetical protein [unclassified Leifsonia]UAJ79798.1 hypothetical protein IT072_01555 [Leifsonia sp. ZF2019]GIT81306.1 hypothetical protein LLS1_29750 [Leifsonia sp. LS1]